MTGRHVSPSAGHKLAGTGCDTHADWRAVARLMGTFMLRPALFALALAIAAPTLAAAKPADITGAWAFVTQTYGPGCQLSGSMVIRQSGKNYVCSFTAQERCPDITIKAQQSCTATRTGDRLEIAATVKKVTPKVGYVPDNFALTIANSAQMKGELHSFHDAPVDFWRGDAPVS